MLTRPASLPRPRFPPALPHSYTHDNFFVYGGGGEKNDFEGHDNTWARNVIAFPSSYILHNGYGGQVGTPGHGILDGHAQQFIDNVALSTRSNEVYALPICSGRGATILAGTRYFVRGGNAPTPCGAGFDNGAVVADYTATMADDAIALARKVLFV